MQSKLPFLSLGLLLANTGAGYLLPNPPGKYNVTLTTGTLTDYNRDARKLMLSIFQPATCAITVPVPYMPNKTASYQGPWIQSMFNTTIDFAPLLLDARLPVCPEASTCSPLSDAPILLLSPGYRGTRLYYNIIASAIASEGFTVMTIDHPGETNIITYPDGSTLYSNLSNVVDLNELTPFSYARAADASFIIDQLSNATAMTDLLPPPPKQPSPIAKDRRIAMLGHSLGGAAAVLAAAHDPRILGVINWDGPFFGTLPPNASAPGLSQQPILYIATDHDEDFPSWSGIWPELTSPKLWVKIAGLTHEGMLDLPTLLEAAAAGLDTGTAGFGEMFGTIAPAESVEILTAYATEWMEGVFAGDLGASALLQGQESERFPAVSVLRKENF